MSNTDKLKSKNGEHLRYNLYGSPDEHPQVVMRQLGITYQHSTPQSIGDQWWFWNCENIPKQLPEYLERLDINPFDAIGYGLSADDALNIWNHETPNRLILTEQEEEHPTNKEKFDGNYLPDPD